MQAYDLLDPKPARPFLGYSVAALDTVVRGFISPEWAIPYQGRHTCTLDTFLYPIIGSFADGIEGLKLEDFKN